MLSTFSLGDIPTYLCSLITPVPLVPQILFHPSSFNVLCFIIQFNSHYLANILNFYVFLKNFYCFIIHMYIQCLGHFSPLPPPLPYHPLRSLPLPLISVLFLKITNFNSYHTHPGYAQLKRPIHLEEWCHYEVQQSP
jgi:hypothetical protein